MRVSRFALGLVPVQFGAKLGVVRDFLGVFGCQLGQHGGLRLAQQAVLAGLFIQGGEEFAVVIAASASFNRLLPFQLLHLLEKFCQGRPHRHCFLFAFFLPGFHGGSDLFKQAGLLQLLSKMRVFALVLAQGVEQRGPLPSAEFAFFADLRAYAADKLLVVIHPPSLGFRLVELEVLRE